MLCILNVESVTAETAATIPTLSGSMTKISEYTLWVVQWRQNLPSVIALLYMHWCQRVGLTCASSILPAVWEWCEVLFLSHISETTSPKFTNFLMLVACSCGLVLLRWHWWITKWCMRQWLIIGVSASEFLFSVLTLMIRWKKSATWPCKMLL